MAGMHAVARPAGIKDAQAHSLFSNILQRVLNGERVYVKDFGSFFAKRLKARVIRSPQIPGGIAEIPERMALRFHASPSTRAVLNGEGGNAAKKPPVKKLKKTKAQNRAQSKKAKKSKKAK